MCDSLSHSTISAEVRNQRVEIIVASLKPSHPAKFLLPVPTTLCSTGLEALALKERMLPPGKATVIPLNWKLPPSHFGLLMPLNQQAKKGVTVLSGVTDLNYQGEIRLLLYNRSEYECVWNTRYPLRHTTMPCD